MEIEVRVSFTDNDGFSEGPLLSASVAIDPALVNSEATGLPTITGTTRVGETLTADTDGIVDGNGIDTSTFSYQWLADGGTIIGERNSTFIPTQAQEGVEIEVEVSFTDNDGFSEGPLLSASVAIDPALVNSEATGLPTITGTTRVGETLTADTDGIVDGNGIDTSTFSYQWREDGGDIAGATNSTFELSARQQGAEIDVEVSFTDNDGFSEGPLLSASVAIDPALPVNSPPTISGTPDTSVAQDATYSFAPVGADIDANTTLTYTLSGNPSWLSIIAATGVVSGTPTNADVDTTSAIIITVADDATPALTATLEFDLTVTNVNDGPTISGTPDTSVAQDATYSFAPVGADIDANTTLTYTLSGNPSWLSINPATGELSGTPTNADVGPTTGIIITVADDATPAPTISGTPDATVAEDSPYSFTPGGGDIDVGDALTYTISGNPSWLSINPATGELSGTPTNADVGPTDGHYALGGGRRHPSPDGDSGV